jgi:murein DD-endopeptidase MepM/ murein hydrolase activator NlpD
MFRWLLVLVVLLGVSFIALFNIAGRSQTLVLTISKPDHAVGQQGTLEITVDGTRGRLTNLTTTLEQGGHRTPLVSLDAASAAKLWEKTSDRITISQPFGKQQVPELQQGNATIVVSAAAKSMLNLRTLSSRTTKDIRVQLEPPRAAVLSTHHYVNHGGSEMVIYRATPPDVDSGVRVGNIEYRGFPASGAGAANADPTTKVAFFALLHDQDLNTPIAVFARDEAGNEAKVSFVDNVFEKPFKKSRIDVDDKFFNKTVPDILQHSPELKGVTSDDLEAAFLKVNGELRRINTDEIIKITSQTSPSRLWSGPFVQLGNSQVEAAFADQRTYIYNGKEIDKQVHLGFDLAVTANVPVLAANAGKVLNASWLGIFGNCIIIDHGMGVSSLYGHLSSFDVKVGDSVTKGQTIGRSGQTGLAGGDHLHFTMLVDGRPANPVEWWDPHWIQDRVDRKLQELGAPAETPATAVAAPRASAGRSRSGRRNR